MGRKKLELNVGYLRRVVPKIAFLCQYNSLFGGKVVSINNSDQKIVLSLEQVFPESKRLTYRKNTEFYVPDSRIAILERKRKISKYLPENLNIGDFIVAIRHDKDTKKDYGLAGFVTEISSKNTRPLFLIANYSPFHQRPNLFDFMRREIRTTFDDLRVIIDKSKVEKINARLQQG